MSFSYRMGRSTVCNVLREMCEVIWRTLQLEFVSLPTEDKWKEISIEFERIWNFPNCIGTC